MKLWKPFVLPGHCLYCLWSVKLHLATIMGSESKGYGKKEKYFVFIATTCFLLDVPGVVSECNKVSQKDMIDIDQK